MKVKFDHEILTEGIELVEANCALAMRRLDAGRVEHMVALEQPYLLLVPFGVEADLAVVASVMSHCDSF